MTKERVALITAGAAGIGLAIAKRLHSEGIKVIAVDKDSNAIESMMAENPDFNPSRIFTDTKQDSESQKKAAYINPLIAHEIYNSQVNPERDNISEFCDALNHIRCELFDTLPDSLKAHHLLKQDVLNEKEIKQLHNIYITLSEDVRFDGDRDLKNAIKQRLVGDQRYNK